MDQIRLATLGALVVMRSLASVRGELCVLCEKGPGLGSCGDLYPMLDTAG